MSDSIKLAYAYGSLRAKTASYKVAGVSPAQLLAGMGVTGGVTGALGSERGDTAEGAMAGVKNVASKGIKSGLSSAALVGLANLATRGRLGREVGGVSQLIGGAGVVGAGLGGTVGSIQNIAGSTDAGARMGIKNPHYVGHDDFYDDTISPSIFDAILSGGAILKEKELL